jgi:hypothetical protein
MDTLLEADTLLDALLAFIIVAGVVFGGGGLLLHRWSWRRWI